MAKSLLLLQQKSDLQTKEIKYLKKCVYSVNGIKYKFCNYTDVIKYFLMKQDYLWPELIYAFERSGICESSEVGFLCVFSVFFFCGGVFFNVPRNKQ